MTPASRVGGIALVAAPVAAAAATLLLLLTVGQTPPVLAWGGLVTLVAAIPLAVARRYRRAVTRGAAVLALGLVAVGILSIGVFFVPALVALVIAGAAPPRGRA